jgi:hypothetical protein
MGCHRGQYPSSITNLNIRGKVGGWSCVGYGPGIGVDCLQASIARVQLQKQGRQALTLRHQQGALWLPVAGNTG